MNQDRPMTPAEQAAREIAEPTVAMKAAQEASKCITIDSHSRDLKWVADVPAMAAIFSRFLKSHEEQVREEYKQLADKWLQEAKDRLELNDKHDHTRLIVVKRYEVKFWCYGERHPRETTVKADSHLSAIAKATTRANLLEEQFYNVESELVPTARSLLENPK